MALACTTLAFGLVGDSWAQLGIVAILAVAVTQAAFLAHDAAHHKIFASARRNEWAARLVVGLVVGSSYGWWTRRHNRHHRRPNQVGADPDITAGAIVYTSDAVAARRGMLQMLAISRACVPCSVDVRCGGDGSKAP